MPTIIEKDLTEAQRKRWMKAVQAFEIKNLGYATQIIQELLKEQPGFLDGRKVLRKAAISLTKGKSKFLSGVSSISLTGASLVKKDPLKAMEAAEKALENDPYNKEANTILKDAAKACNQLETAVFALETIISGNPKDTKALHELGKLFLEQNDPQRATEVYARIKAIDPSDLIAVKAEKDASASATIKGGGWGQATSFQDVLANKDDARKIADQNRMVRSLEMVEEQIGEFQAKWDQQQESVDLTRKLAKLWEERLEYKQDAESIEGALYFYDHANKLLNGADANVVRRISDLHMRRNDAMVEQHTAYLKSLEEWMASQPPEVDVEVQKAQAEETRQLLAQLAKQREQTILDEAKLRVERNPTDLQLRFELGERLLEMGNFTDAIPELQRARQNPNTRLRAMSHLGRCFVLKGMMDMAASQFEAATKEMVAMDAVKKDTLYDLALVYEKMGQKEKYLEALKAILEVDYSYKDASERVEKSYST